MSRGPRARSQLGPPLVVDTHVHVHDCFDRRSFCDAAAANLLRASRALAPGGQPAGVLMLAEISGVHVFAELARQGPPTRQQLGDWIISPTDDRLALLLERPDAIPLVLIGGRQIRTRQGLEILALGSEEGIEDGQTLKDTVSGVREAGALPILPWGFGKWTFARRQLVRQAIDEETPGSICLGDIGGRRKGSREPELLATARQRGFPILPGSDPLPFPSQVKRAGASGLCLPISLDTNSPTAGILQALRTPRASTQSYLHGEILLTLLWHQLLMQLRKRQG